MISEPVLVVAVPAGASEAHLRLSKALRALAVSQFPITIDPSTIISGSGALDPVRDVARVITVATRDCVVIGAWAGRVGEGVAVHQPNAGDFGQQGCVHGCESPSVGDRANAGALLGVVLAYLAGIGEVASRSPGATREISCSGRPIHMSTSSGSAIKVCTWCATLGRGSPNDLVQQPP
jgi:hypothetical protein